LIALLNWNIRHGGGKRIPAILDAVESIHPDIAVFTEYRNNHYGCALRKGMSKLGLLHQHAGVGSSRQNSLLIAARFSFNAETFAANAQRCILARFPSFSVFAFYFACGSAKYALFDFILGIPDSFLETPTLLVGDFNTGKHYIDEEGATFVGTRYLTELENRGWVDVWRLFHGDAREFSWFSNAGNGFRVDHAFASKPMLPHIFESRYAHEYRKSGLSDHSSMILQIKGVGSGEQRPGADAEPRLRSLFQVPGRAAQA
jgi:exodeoxyribonuclease-3